MDRMDQEYSRWGWIVILLMALVVVILLVQPIFDTLSDALSPLLSVLGGM